MRHGKKRHLHDPYLRADRSAESELFRRLTPAAGWQGETLQGTLLPAVHRLEVELLNRGGSDWDDNLEQYEAYCEIVLHCLCDGTFDAKKTAMVRYAISSLRRWMAGGFDGADWILNLLVRVGTLAYHWYCLHPEPIPWARDPRLEMPAEPL